MSEEKDRVALGQRLREAREYLGFSQGDVARALKCSRSSVTLWEQGTLKIFAYQLDRLARLYCVPVGVLLGDEVSCEKVDPGLAVVLQAAPAEDRDELAKFARFLRWRRQANEATKDPKKAAK